MRHGATFINTGRGATVVESDLVRVMRERPDLTALLDQGDLRQNVFIKSDDVIVVPPRKRRYVFMPSISSFSLVWWGSW